MNETIVAICTPPGMGAIAVIRLSGPLALSITNSFFSGDLLSYDSHTAHLGNIFTSGREVIDEVLLLLMHEGKSYTGEATVEIMCHGGVVIPQKILRRALEAGARAAGAGEFTYRAFQNGRIDLLQAEAVQELIAAKSDRAVKIAKNQLTGTLSTRIGNLQKQITEVTAIIEAGVDYPEDGLEFASEEELIAMLQNAISQIETLTSTFHDGQKIFNGLIISILGKPNVGKSSLLNALIDKDRAIITEIPGTTRDILEEELYIDGLRFRVQDTAGIRDHPERIEEEGIKRSLAAAKEADILLILLDLTKKNSEEEDRWITLYKRALIVGNKRDLPHQKNQRCHLTISAKENLGLDDLKRALFKCATLESTNDHEDVMLTQERHYHALKEAKKALEITISGLKSGLSRELLSLDLRSALKELSTIIGVNVTEEILSSIFSKFCVGK